MKRSYRSGRKIKPYGLETADFFPLVLGRNTDEKETCEESEMETKTTLMGVSKDFFICRGFNVIQEVIG